MLPTLRQLQYVVAVADTGQFVEAARQCAVSQPALSRQVQEVESQLGVRLFERTRPRVIVTPAGEEVVRRARSLLVAARELVEAAGGRARQLRLGVIPTIAPYGLPGVLTELRLRYPDVAVVVEELQTEVLLERLRAGTVDLALLAHPFDDHGLHGVDVATEPFVLVAPADHALAVPEAATGADIAGASLLLMDDGHCLRDQALDVCALAGAEPSTSVAAASLSTLVRMVESGLGPTLLPASALAVELRGGLVARSFVGLQPGRTVTLQWRGTSPFGEWFGAIGAVLAEHYRELNAGLPEVAGPVPRITSLPGARAGSSPRGG